MCRLPWEELAQIQPSVELELTRLMEQHQTTPPTRATALNFQWLLASMFLFGDIGVPRPQILVGLDTEKSFFFIEDQAQFIIHYPCTVPPFISVNVARCSHFALCLVAVKSQEVDPPTASTQLDGLLHPFYLRCDDCLKAYMQAWLNVFRPVLSPQCTAVFLNRYGKQRANFDGLMGPLFFIPNVITQHHAIPFLCVRQSTAATP